MERCSGDNASTPVPFPAVRNELAPFVDMLSATQRGGAPVSAALSNSPLSTKARTHMSKAQKLLSKTRGATIVEYAMLIIAVMFIAAATFRVLGNKVKDNAQKSTDEIGKTS